MDRQLLTSVGLCVMRVTVGAMLAFGHGWGKLSNFGKMSERFPDLLGLGSTAALVLAIFGEFFCSLAVAAGFLTRLAAIPPLITMLVAVLAVHTDDPWAKKEFALLYAIPFFTLIFTGPGQFSLDAVLWKSWKNRKRFAPARSRS
jgi:putative oxidoreductase